MFRVRDWICAGPNDEPRSKYVEARLNHCCPIDSGQLSEDLARRVNVVTGGLVFARKVMALFDVLDWDETSIINARRGDSLQQLMVMKLSKSADRCWFREAVANFHSQLLRQCIG